MRRASLQQEMCANNVNDNPSSIMQKLENDEALRLVFWDGCTTVVIPLQLKKAMPLLGYVECRVQMRCRTIR